MSNKDGGGPAFPLTADVIRNVSAMLAASDLPAERRDYLLEKFGERATGMTVRDYFAAKAMQGFASCDDVFPRLEAMAEAAYLWADHMLKARDA